MTYDELIAKWNTKQVTRYGGQCVALISEFEAVNNRPIVWGDAVKWINNPIMAPIYDWVWNDPARPDQLPIRGDIVVWDADLPYTDGAGHIAFYDSPLDNHQMMSFGQNSGGPTAHFQSHSWAHVAGWHTLKDAPPLSAPYRVEDVPTKEIQLTRDTQLWNMTYRTMDDMSAHPVRAYAQGYRQTTAAICHHDCGESYYMVGNNDTTGFNTADCSDYVPPAPYVPPAAPIPIPEVTRRKLEWGVPTYATAMDAKMKRNPTGYMSPGTYIVLEADGKSFNLTHDNRLDGDWVNFDEDVMPVPVEPDVVPPALPPKIVETIANASELIPVNPPSIPLEPTPVTEPVSPTLPPAQDWHVTKSLRPDGKPVYFRACNTVPLAIKDLDGKLDDIIMQPYNKDIKGEPQPLAIVQYFWKEDNTGQLIQYARAQQVTKKFWYYGVPVTYLEEIPNESGDYNHDGKRNLEDVGDAISDFIDYAHKGFRQATHKISNSEKLTAVWTRGIKTIDGIRAGRKVKK